MTKLMSQNLDVRVARGGQNVDLSLTRQQIFPSHVIAEVALTLSFPHLARPVDFCSIVLNSISKPRGLGQSSLTTYKMGIHQLTT